LVAILPNGNEIIFFHILHRVLKPGKRFCLPGVVQNLLIICVFSTRQTIHLNTTFHIPPSYLLPTCGR